MAWHSPQESKSIIRSILRSDEWHQTAHFNSARKKILTLAKKLKGERSFEGSAQTQNAFGPMPMILLSSLTFLAARRDFFAAMAVELVQKILIRANKSSPFGRSKRFFFFWATKSAAVLVTKLNKWRKKKLSDNDTCNEALTHSNSNGHIHISLKFSFTDIGSHFHQISVWIIPWKVWFNSWL